MTLRGRALEIFDYDPATGWFTNRFSRGRAVRGARAGSPSGHGYRKLCIDYCRYYEHQIAWLIIYGEWPSEIDHRDGDRSNNAIANLRECNRTLNNFNREESPDRSGLRGAYLDPRNLQWYSKIQVRGQVIWLGNFDSPEAAHAAYIEAASKIAGEFAFHNQEPQPLTSGAI